MINNKAIALAICSSLLLFSACNPTKKLAKTPSITTPIPDEPVGKAITAQTFLSTQIIYSTFDGKAAAHIKTDVQDRNVDIKMRMTKDQNLWASILAIGGLFEPFRALATPDSLQALDRLQRRYYKLSFEQGVQLIQAPIEFQSAQNLMVGNPLFTDGAISSFDTSGNTAVIVMKKKEFTQTLTYDKATKELRKLELAAPSRSFNLVINYSNYQPLANLTPFSKSRSISIDDKGKQLMLTLDFNENTFNGPIDQPFTIPNSYKEGSIKK